MESQTKNCQNCKNEFTIETEDFNFYEKIKVPPPTWCPECRFLRRLQFLNWTSLYKRNCDSCGNGIIAAHHKDKKFKVFCNDCWWSDDWDGTEYGMEYDPNKNFFEQLKELRDRSVFMALENLHTALVDTPYANATSYLKNCFMLFNADYGKDSAYCIVVFNINQCLDCYRIKNSELCYESTGIHKCFKCIYSEELDSCSDVLFSRACWGCNYCFGCINIRNKSYCIFNKQYSKEEYFKKLELFRLNTKEGIEWAIKESSDFWMKHPQRAVIGNNLNLNTTGDFVYESKNTKDAYMVSEAEDCRYVQFLYSGPIKNCYDYTNWGMGAENLYECLTVGEGAFSNKFCVQSWPNAMESEYCLYSIQPKNCFGCVNLKRKQYCILNKQYSKEEYFRLRQEIIDNLKKDPYIDSLGRTWSYGEQIPLDISPFAYNETIANYYKKLTKEEALIYKIPWYDVVENQYQVTISNEKIPSTLEKIDESFLNEVLECKECQKAYKINNLELTLLKKIGVPLPTKCWKCRYERRFSRVNKNKLYNRNCNKCNIKIKTSYDPDRPEIVYCVSCYQAEFL